MELDVVSYGDLVADMLLTIPTLPLRANEIQLAHRMAFEPGGAGNFLIMAQRLGLKAGASGCVGGDHFGQLLLEKLRGEGIDTGGTLSLEGHKNTLVLVFIDDAGEHVFLGVLGDILVTKIEEAFREKIASARVLFTNGYAFIESSPPQLVIEIMEMARQSGKLVFLDPGPQIYAIDANIMRKAIAKADYLLLTQEEGVALVGGTSAEATASALLALGPRMVALKLGKQGSLIVDRQISLRSEAFPVTLVDSTGSGDAFDAAFVYGILNGMALEEIGRLANAAGGATVTHNGAGTGLPLKAEIEALFGGQIPAGC